MSKKFGLVSLDISRDQHNIWYIFFVLVFRAIKMTSCRNKWLRNKRNIFDFPDYVGNALNKYDILACLCFLMTLNVGTKSTSKVQVDEYFEKKNCASKKIIFSC